MRFLMDGSDKSSLPDGISKPNNNILLIRKATKNAKVSQPIVRTSTAGWPSNVI